MLCNSRSTRRVLIFIRLLSNEKLVNFIRNFDSKKQLKEIDDNIFEVKCTSYYRLPKLLRLELDVVCLVVNSHETLISQKILLFEILEFRRNHFLILSGVLTVRILLLPE